MNDDVTYDTVSSGIAVLASDAPDWDDGPFPVQGVALPEDIVTSGANSEGVDVYWPPETVEAAAEEFEDVKITDPSEHDPETAVQNPQPSPETIVGEITDVRYRPGVGILYAGEVDDPEIAKRVERDRVEVSPTLFRRLGGEHDETGARVAEDIATVRDLSVVAEGAADGNSIDPAPAAATALAAETLAATFADDGDDGSAETPDDTSSGVTDEADATDDATDDAESASAANTSDDGESPSTVGPADASDATTTDPTDTMTDDDITDAQRKLLAAAEPLDDPTVVESEHVDVLEAAADCEEPAVIEQDAYEALQADLHEAKQLFAEALRKRDGMSMPAEKIAENFSYDALREEFEDDDGDLDAETLVQVPEAGSTAAGGTDPEDDPEIAEVLEKYDADSVDEAVETLETRHEHFDDMGWETKASEAADELSTLGVDA